MKLQTTFLTTCLRILCPILFLTSTIPVHSQIKKSKTWDICIHGGLTIPNTDLSVNNNSNGIGLGYSVTKFILPFLAIQEQLLVAKLKGTENGTSSNSKYNFETNTFYTPSLHILVQVGNIGFLHNVPDLSIYTSFGIGYFQFSPSVFREDSTIARNYYVQNNLLDNSVDYSETKALTFPIAVGLKYRFQKRLSFHIEYSQRLTNTDKLDGWYRLLSGNDSFSYLNLGLTLHIGRL